MKILLLDNYDSFTWNLFHALEKVCDAEISVIRNDKIDSDSVEEFEAIIFSPGPGLPSEAGNMMEILRQWKEQRPILGVCLGHQAIAESYGGKLKNLFKVFHGVEGDVDIIENDLLFKNIPSPFKAGRYHSWAVCEPLPPELKTLARSQSEVMALRHQSLTIYGVQFHPESIMTPYGETLLRNWFTIAQSEIKRVKEDSAF